jgi:hypothetical protein
VPESAAPSDVPEETALVAECLARWQEGGIDGLSRVLREHPGQSRVVLRRLLLLAQLGLLPDPPAGA